MKSWLATFTVLFTVAANALPEGGDRVACEVEMTAGGRALALVKGLQTQTFDAGFHEAASKAAKELTEDEKVELVKIAGNILSHAEVPSRVLVELMINLEIPASRIISESTTAKLFGLYFTPTNLEKLRETARPEDQLLVAKALLSQRLEPESIQNAVKLVPKESDRVELADFVLKAEKAKLTGDEKMPKGLYYFSVAHGFQIQSQEGMISLANAFLKAGILYKTDPNDADKIVIVSTGDEAILTEKFYELVRSWPEEARNKFAKDFVAAAKDMRLMYLVDLKTAFDLHDAKVIRDINAAQVKAYLKRWKTGIKFETLRPKFMEAGLGKDPWDLIRLSLDYNLLSKHVPFDEFYNSLVEFSGGNSIEMRTFFSKPVWRRILHHYGVRALMANLEVTDYAELPLRPSAEHSEEPALVPLVEQFMAKHPGVFPEKLVLTILEGTGDRDTFLYLLDETLKRVDQIEGNLDAGYFDYLNLIFHWPAEKVSAWGSSGLHDVLSITAELNQITGKNIFDYLKVDSESFPTGESLAELLEMIRNSYQLEVHHLENPEKALKPTAKNTDPKGAILSKIIGEIYVVAEGELAPVSQETVAGMVSKAKGAFVERIQKTFEGETEGIQISYDDLMRLQEEWSDIEPILTLYSRLTEPSARKLVLEVFRHSLDGTFGDFKFYAPEAGPQVGFMNEKQMNAWTKSRVRVFSPAQEAKKAKLREAQPAFTALAEGQLTEQLKSTALWADLQTPSLVDVEIDGLVQKSRGANPLEVIADHLMEQADPQALENLARKLYVEILDPNGNLSRKRDLVRLFGGMVSKTLSAKLGDAKNDLIATLKQLEKLIPKAEDPELEAMGIIVSVVDHSPRLLLTVGDLVQTQSCQNYKTGGMIYTLPAYVVDANVQAMASFHVEAKHFKSHQDYRTVSQALENGEIAKVSFDGNRRTLRFQFKGDAQEPIDTEYLGYAYLRQMVKLGYVDTGTAKIPSIRLEKEYVQNDVFMEDMQANHKALLRDLVKELGADQTQTMVIPKTRNPSGIYSDLGIRQGTNNGVQTEAYKFAP